MRQTQAARGKAETRIFARAPFCGKIFLLSISCNLNRGRVSAAAALASATLSGSSCNATTLLSGSSSAVLDRPAVRPSSEEAPTLRGAQR